MTDVWQTSCREIQNIHFMFNNIFKKSRCYKITWENMVQPDRLQNEERNDLYSSPNIFWVIKSRIMRWAGHVARMRQGQWNFIRTEFSSENMREIGELEDPDIDERFPKVRGISWLAEKRLVSQEGLCFTSKLVSYEILHQGSSTFHSCDWTKFPQTCLKYSKAVFSLSNECNKWACISNTICLTGLNVIQ